MRAGATWALGFFGLALTGCAALIGRQAPPPPKPAPVPPPVNYDAIARTCSFAPVNGEDGQPLRLFYRVSCTTPAGVKDGDMAVAALMAMGVQGMFDFESEFFIAERVTSARPTEFVVLALWGDGPGAFAQIKKPDGSYYTVWTARDVLGDRYARWRLQAEIAREDRIYGQCRTLVMSIEASVRDPERAQACGTTMAVIDRAREGRRRAAEAEENRQRHLAEQNFQQQQLLIQRQQLTETQRLREDEAAAARRRALGESLRRIGDSFKPPPSYRTQCRTDYFGNTNCTTTQR